MSLLRKYDSCIGLLLFKCGQYTAELWYCPAGYVIPEHSHPHEDIELMFIMGQTTFYRRKPFKVDEQSYTPKWYQAFRTFSVEAGWSHRFTVGKLPLVFINFAKWQAGIKPTSASVDFELLTK